MEKEPIYLDIRELFNPKLFQPEKKPADDDEPSIPIRHMFNGKLTMTVQEMAEQLNVSTATAYELTERAGFPVIPLTERRKIIPVEGLMNWLREQTGRADK